jgi:transcriptional regulator with XRE-family HTH domain
MGRKPVKDARYYLRMWRAEKDISQQRAAQMFNVTASHWSLLEGGHRTPSPELAAELARKIGQPIEVFLGVEVKR